MGDDLRDPPFYPWLPVVPEGLGRLDPGMGRDWLDGYRRLYPIHAEGHRGTRAEGERRLAARLAGVDEDGRRIRLTPGTAS